MTPIRVLVAEDAHDYREFLEILVTHDPDLELVGAASEANEAIAMAEAHRPDVAVLDVVMPGGGGAKAAREIRRRSPATRVLGLSGYKDRSTVVDMLRSGAEGYLLKGTPPREIVEVIRRTARGESSLSPDVTAELIEALSEQADPSQSITNEMRRLDRTRTELLQILAHELFTPITVIQGAAQLLAKDAPDVPRRRIDHLAPLIKASVARLQRLVRNIYIAATLDRDSADLSRSLVPVGMLLEKIGSEFPQAPLRVRLPTDRGLLRQPVWVDLDLAGRALAIVVENALDLSPESEPVQIDVLARDGWVHIMISDRGPGISDEARRRLFEPFAQVDSSATRGHEGLGVGLFLARRILSAHRGRIAFEPRPGGGTTFTLSFRAAPGSTAGTP